MAKPRKTKKEKIQSSFRVTAASLQVKKSSEKFAEMSQAENKYLRADLTKTLVLTMLVLALEVAVWQFLSKH